MRLGSPQRSAFTLFELLLVLALLVIMGSIAAVSITAGDERVKLRQSADRLARAWTEARLQAIESGSPRVFRCRIGDSWGYVGVSDNPSESLAVAATQAATGTATGQTELQLSDEQQDSSVVFEQLLVSPRPGEPAIGGGVSDGGLSAMILFYPDGATSDAEATLTNDNGRSLRVTLRGLTGAARVTDPLDDPLLPGAR